MSEQKLKLKKNYLLEKIPAIMKDELKGSLLDLGCGWGMYSIELHNLGFEVTGADIAADHFKFHDRIKFKKCNLVEKLPFNDSSFDYLLFLEVIEHLEKPFEVIGELSRVLKPGGKLILSTPNILNLGSRMRFLFEGCWDFFREPILDYQEHYIGTIENMHIIPWRYHELEYLLYRKGFAVEHIFTDYVNNGLKPLYYLLYPLLLMQRRAKERKSLRKGGMDFKRINDILFSKELIFGKHLIVKAVNRKDGGQALGHYKDTKIHKYQATAN